MIPTALVVKAKAKQLPIYEALLQCLEAGTGWKEMRRLWQSEWNRWELAGFTGCEVKRLTCTYLYVSVGCIQLYKLYLYRFLFEQRLPLNVQSCLSCLSYRCPSESGWGWLFYMVSHVLPPGSGRQGRSACGAPNMLIKCRCLETGLPRVKLAKALPNDEDVFAS